MLPPGIRVTGCTEIPDAGKRDLLNAFNLAEYTLICASPIEYTAEQARSAVTELLGLAEIPIVREREGRIKTIDIRPMISEVEFVDRDSENGRLSWRAVVGIGAAGNVKPGDLVSALAHRLPGLTLRRAHRVRLLTSEALEALN